MKTINYLLLSILSFGLLNVANAQDNSPYMGGDAEIITMPNGAMINSQVPELLPQTTPAEPAIVQVTDGVWSLEGYGFANMGVIEGETGLIIYDVGDDNKDGRLFIEAVRQVSDKPVKAIIYSHSHYVWGGRPMLEGNEDYIVIGHPNINKNILESGGVGAAIPELSPLLMARAYEQFAIYLPKEGPDAPITPSPIGSGDKEFLPVTHPVQNGEIMIVDGIELQFFTNYHSDTDDCLFVYMPQKEVVFSNLYWPGFPNLYTLRGSLYRDPGSWMEGLRMIRDLAPEHKINTHTFAISGKEKVAEAITNYHDGIAFVYDQTIRRILLGESPDEMRHTIQLPQHLADWPANQRTYGELSYYAPNIYYYALGWYDGDAAHINPVHPDVAAQKIVEGYGGKKKVEKAIVTAMKNEEYAWAVQLSDYLYKVYPSDQNVRQLKADALRKMGQLTLGSIPRSWYLSQALALENKIHIAQLIMPTADQVMQSAPGTYVDLMRVRINPELSMNTDKVIVFDFTDLKQDASFGLHIRKGVAEYLSAPHNYYKGADVRIKLPRNLFVEFYLGKMNIEELMNSNEVKIAGSEAEARNILKQFDQYNASAPGLKFQP